MIFDYNDKAIFRQSSRGSSGGASLCLPPKRTVLLAFVLAAILAAVLAVTLAGVVSHAGEPGHVTVLNPKSYPLVGGTWAVHLDIKGGGTMTVSAANGTAFGEDVEFAGMYGRSDARSEPSFAEDGNTLRFDYVQDGQWTFEVNVLTGGPHHLRFELGGDAYASNTASLAGVTSSTPDGTYSFGDSIDIRINFSEPVTLQHLLIRDGLGDLAGGTFSTLDDPVAITTTRIGSSYYALVAAYRDDGIQIINITDPASLVAVSSVRDGEDGFDRLADASSVTTVQIGQSHYALVAAQRGDGVQIINITDPADPAAVSSVHDGEDGFDRLNGARSITTVHIGDHYYALVAAGVDDGVQIINITDPADPAAVSSVHDGEDGFDRLNGARSITTVHIGDHYYALVAAQDDHSIEIINITDPANPTAASSVVNNQDGFRVLHQARSVTTIEIDSSHYALVAAYNERGVEIIDITDPYNPAPVSRVQDGEDGFEILEKAISVTTVHIGDHYYALVAAQEDDGVQMINITDPYNPVPVTHLSNGEGGFEDLDDTKSVTTVHIGDHYYALTTAGGNNGVQMIDITDPVRPVNALLPYVELDLAGDRRAIYSGQEDGNRTMVFAYPVRLTDYTADLAYAGTDALHMRPNTLADDGTDLLPIILPVPGQPNSLSHNKDIVLAGIPPVTADAGASQTVGEGDTVTLSGSATSRENDPITYAWSQASPATPSITFANASSPATTFTAPSVTADTTFTLTLNATDGTDSATDTLDITVKETGMAFITTWTASDSDVDVTLPMEGTYSILWGDGSYSGSVTGPQSHTYGAAGDYAVTVLGDGLKSIKLWPDGANARQLKSIDQWGGTKWTTMNGAFGKASNMVYRATDVPDLSRVTDMIDMFRDAASFNGNITKWDTSSVRNMANMFRDAASFNGNITKWDTSSVRNMANMFRDAASFDQPLDWDTSSVTDMGAMFSGAASFNGNITKWDTSSVRNMVDMFYSATSFDQPLDWDTSSVTDMDGMFSRAYSFNGNITKWDTSSVTDMGAMFSGADSFNGNITKWDTSSVTDMSAMFSDADSFDQPLDWDTSSVTDMIAMFSRAYSFNGNITKWDTSSVTDMADMFGDTASFNQPLDWDTSSVTDMAAMFGGAASFNGNITKWDTSSVRNMAFMFSGAASFDQPLDWDTSSVRSMADMFGNAASFNGNITKWDTSSVTDMAAMFFGADSFDQPLDWDTSSVRNMAFMFSGAASFNGNITKWDTSSVTDMTGMFRDAASFDQPLGAWKVSSVTTMSRMFSGANAFDQNLGAWYITLNSTAIDRTNIPGMVGQISPQNRFLNDQRPAYDTVSNIDSARFVIDSKLLTMTSITPAKATYIVNITATGFNVFENGNNWRAFEITVDGDVVLPAPSLTTDSPSPTSAASVTVTVDFGEPIDGATFTLDDISVTGGDASVPAQDGSTTQQYAFTVAPSSDGPVTVSIPADRVTDPAGNGNTVSNALSITFDRTAPGPTLSTDAASPTNAASVTVTVDFGEPIDAATFTLDDISVTGGDASVPAQEGATTQQYAFTVTPSSDGPVTVSIPADRVTDPAGNGNTASNPLSVTFDRTAFGPTLSTDTASPTNAASVTVAVDFGEPIDPTTFTLADISVAGGDASVPAQDGSTTQQYAFTVTPSSDGLVTVSIPADRVTDPAGNGNTVSNALSMTFDSAAPAPTLSTDAASPTNAASVIVTVDFGEPIDGATFTLDDISVTGGDASVLAQEGATTQQYAFTVTPSSDGPVTVSIPADRVTDPAGNGNTASNPLSVTFDRTAFGPTLSTDTASPTNAASVTVAVDFGEPIDPTTFTLADISVTGGDASVLAQEGATTQKYTFTVTPDADGQVTASIPAGRVTDPAGNGNTASNTLSVTFDRTAFSPALSTDATSPTNAASVTVAVDFGEPIDPTTFTLADISVAGGDASVLAQEGATTQKYTFTVTPSSDGQVTASIPAGRVTDPAGNGNTASNTLSVTFDRTAFSPALSTDATSPTNAASVTVAVDFGEPIDPTTFTLADISVAGGDASVLAQEGATTQKYTFTVTPDADGQVTASIPAGRVTDPAGNGNTASNTLSVTFDRTAFSPALSTDATSPTNAASVTVAVDFGEPIDPTTFTLADISVAGGDASVLAQEGATTQKYTFTVTPDADGQVTASIPAGRVTDPAGNGNTASNPLSVTFDRTGPAPILSSTTAFLTSADSATITVDFGEPIDAATFTLDDISVTGGDASGLAQEGATTQKYTFTVAPSSDGPVTVSIPADRVKDLVGNNNTASGQTDIATTILQINFDRIGPAPTLSTTEASPTNSGSATITVDFGESINGTTFILADISVTGGTASDLTHSSANQTFTFTLTPSTDGQVIASIPADRVMDPVGNNNTVSNALSITFDSAAPAPTLSTDTASPTNAASVTVAVDFGEPIDPTTFTLADISVAGGDASVLAQEGATTQKYTFTVTPDADGQVTASIPAGRVTDPAGNGNTASNTLSITFDSAAPAPTLSTDTASPTNAASVTVAVDFGEPIDPTTFTLADISVAGGDASVLAQEGATTQKYTFTVTPDADGQVTASIPAGRVTDPAGNGNTASNPLSVTFDRTGPAPILSSTTAFLTSADSATITVDFGEPIDAATFTLDDISVTGGDASGLAQEGATTQKYTFTVAPSSDGPVTVSIPADRVKDLVGNNNTASGQTDIATTILQINFDRIGPAPTLSTTEASPTNSGSATITVDFGESINGTTFILADISVTGGTASDLTHSSANQTFTFTLTPSTDGQVIASIPADRVMDPVGNNNTVSNALSITFDSAAPAPTLSTDTASPTNAASVTVAVDFGEPIDGATFTLDDISVTGGDASVLAQGGATTQQYAFTVTPSSDGQLTVSIPADRVTDPAGNGNTVSNALSITFDSAAPAPTLSTDTASPTNAASVTVAVDFGEPIDGATFTLDDISVTGGDASVLAQGGATTQQYAFTVTPSSDGQLTVSIPADRVTDPAGNGNTASNTLSITFDSAAPAPTLSTDTASPTNAASVIVTVDFGEPIDGATFTLDDISVAGGDASVLAQGGATTQQYAFTVTPSSDGQLTVSIPADRVTDPAGNGNTASNTLSITFDSAAPAPTLSTDTASPTNAASVIVTVDFGKPIDAATFTLADISVTGGDASGLAQEGATTQQYAFTVTPASDGTITATIPADRVKDPAGNSNTVSNALSITFDGAAPGPTLSTDADSPTNAASVTVAVDFGKPIDPATFTLADISVAGGTASNLVHSSANQNFTFTVTPDADGQVTASIPAGRVKDPADNGNTASNPLSVTFDRTAPGPTLSTDAASPTNAASVTVAVDFGKPIDPATFTLTDISVAGGTASNLAHSSANQNFTFTLAPSTDGQVTATIPADRVKDPADNGNTASNPLSVTFDRTAPGPTLSTDADSPTNAASVTVAVDFGKPIDPATFTLADISVAGGTASNLVHSSANQNFTFTVTPDADGQVTASIPAGRVKDPADNGNTASNPLSVTFDRTAPGPTLSTDAASPTNAASVTVAVDFGKPIDPATFTLTDISVAGGTASNLAHSSANQNFTFTLAPSTDGQVTATIPADRVKDPADNGNTASNPLSVTFDRTAPGPTLSTDAASPTNAASVTVAVDFGEPIDPVTFTLADISVAGGTASNLAHSSANQNFTFTVTPDADGQVTVTIPAGGVEDESGNLNTASNPLSVTFDRTAPGPTLSTDADSPTNAASVTVAVDFGKPIDPATFTLADISVAGGTASNLAHSSANQNFTFTVTPDADGQVTASIPADRVKDPADNGNTVSNALSITFDRTAPGPTLSTDADSPTNAASVTVAVDFGKPIDPATFTLADISVAGGTASNLAHSSANQNFTFTITPDADGQVTASIPADRVKDPADNGNTASNPLSVTFDRTAFKPSLTTRTPSPTNFPSVTVTVDFGEPIDPATFALADDVTVTGGAVSRLAHLSGNRTFTFTLAPDGDGTATVAIPAGGIKDESGNLNTASDTLSITFDTSRPTPSLTTDTPSPTNSPSVTVTVDFGEPINATAFDLADDVTVTGGTVSGLAHLSGNRTFTFTLAPDGDGTATVAIPAGGVKDESGNLNTASDTLSITFDTSRPIPSLTTDAPSPTNFPSVTVTVDFGEPINATAFALADDVTVTGGAVSGLAHLSGNRTFTFTLAPDGDGTATVAIPAGGVKDESGNLNTASDTLSITFDSAHGTPTVDVSTADLTTRVGTYLDLPTNALVARVTIEFSRPIDVATLNASDVLASGGTVSGLPDSRPIQRVTDNRHFTFDAVRPSDGLVTVWVPAGSVVGLDGSLNTASNRLEILFDRTAPTVSIVANSSRIIQGIPSYALPTGSCSDALSGPTSTIPTIDSSGIDPYAVGSYAAIYTCTDRAGNSAHERLSIDVVSGDPNMPPTHASTTAASPTNSPSATVEADAANRPPVARTYPDHHYNRTSAPALHVLSLDGSLSYDPDGDTLSYRWAQVSGSAVTITDPASRYTTFGMTGPPSPATLIFRLTVSDGQYNSTDRYTVQVDRPRTGEPPAGPPPGYPVLAFTGSSPAGPLSASISVDFGAPVDPRSFTVRDDVAVNGGSFRQGVGRLVDWDHQYFTFRLVAPSEGTFAVTVRAGAVTYLDGTPNPASNALVMTFENGTVSFLESALAAGDPPQANSPPTVDAGQDDSVREGLSFTLAGSATDPDGDSLAYLWSHDSDLEIGLFNPGSPTPSFTAPPVGSDATITFTLTVTDQHNATSAASVRITVTDAPVPPTSQRLATQPPVARPGSQPVPALSTVATAPLEYATITVDFGRPINATTFSISDISVTGGDASGLSPSPGDLLFTFEVTHNDADDDTGRLTVRIPAGAVTYQDGTPSAASNVLSLTFDRMGPVPAISTDAPSPTNAASMAVTVDFGEPVGALDLADVRVAGGTASGLSQEGAAASFTVTPDGDGQVEVLIPGGAVKDLAGNHGSASNRIAVTFDATPPTVAVNATSVRIPLGSASYDLPDGACGDATSGPVSTGPAVTHSIDAAVAGSYQVTYECADRAGNTARTAITATVYEPAPEAAGTPVRNATIALRGGASITVTQGYHHDAGAICRTDDGTWWDARSSFADVATSGGSMRNYYVDLGEHNITYTCGEGYAATAARTVTVTDAPPAFDWGDYPDYVLCVDITDGVRIVHPDGNGDYACTDSHGHTIAASGPP